MVRAGAMAPPARGVYERPQGESPLSRASEEGPHPERKGEADATSRQRRFSLRPRTFVNVTWKTARSLSLFC